MFTVVHLCSQINGNLNTMSCVVKASSRKKSLNKAALLKQVTSKREHPPASQPKPCGLVFEGHFYCRASLNVSGAGFPDWEITRLHSLAPEMKCAALKRRKDFLAWLREVSDSEEESEKDYKKPKSAVPSNVLTVVPSTSNFSPPETNKKNRQNTHEFITSSSPQLVVHERTPCASNTFKSGEFSDSFFHLGFLAEAVYGSVSKDECVD